jgi:hypothetical protein
MRRAWRGSAATGHIGIFRWGNLRLEMDVDMDGFIRRSFAIACALFAASAWVLAADAIESRPVHFAKGATSATLKGTLKGDKIIDYKLGAKAGRTMRVTLKTSNGANYFNVLPPGSNDVAVFVGSTGGNEWSGQLATDGEYTIRVYLMRSAGRPAATRRPTTRSPSVSTEVPRPCPPLGPHRPAMPRSKVRRTTRPGRCRARWELQRKARRSATTA